MTLEAAIYTRLSGYSGLTALVSSRIYPGHLAETAAVPAVSFFRVSATRPSCMGSDSGIVRARIQVDVWAKTYDSAKSIGVQVQGALQRWRTTTGITVQDVFFLSEADLYEPQPKIHHLALDFEAIYLES